MENIKSEKYLEENFLVYTIGFVLLTWLTIFLINKQFLFNSAKNHLLKLNWKICVLVLLLFSATIIILPLILMAYMLCGLFKNIVGIVLKLKYKSKFGGFLQNLDAMWVVEPISKAVMQMCILAEFEGELDEFCEKIRKNIEERCFSGQYPKMTSTRHKCMGYTYLLRDELDINECISLYQCKEEFVTQEVLERTASSVSNKALPKNHCALWEIVVLNKPIRSDENKTQYFAILRLHHTLCDGVGIHKITVGCFADEENLQNDLKVDSNIIDQSLHPYRILQLVAKLKACYKMFTICCVLPTVGILLFLGKKYNFKRPQMTGEKICICSLEDNPKYFKIIKDIKSKVPNISITDIIYSAISASFMENVAKDADEYLNFITFVVTVLPYLNKFPKQRQGKGDIQVLNNDSTALCFFQAPGYMQKNRSSVDRLMEVQRGHDLLRNSYDAEVAYWIFRIASTILPNYTAKLLFGKNCALLVSNVPGIPTIKMFGGCPVNDLFGYAINYMGTGMSLCITTYENRFHFALMVDKGLIPNEDIARSFTHRIFKYLDRLNEELGKSL